MDKGVIALGTFVELLESFNVIKGVIETGSNDKSLVGEDFAVAEGKLVGLRSQLGNSSLLNQGPWVDHSLAYLSVTLEVLDVLLEDTEVGLGL